MAHFKKLDIITQEAGLTFCPDKDETSYNWDNHFDIDLESLNQGLNLDEGLRLYTDGSKMGSETG